MSLFPKQITFEKVGYIKVIHAEVEYIGLMKCNECKALTILSDDDMDAHEAWHNNEFVRNVLF
jgi:hypothetical protein